MNFLFTEISSEGGPRIDLMPGHRRKSDECGRQELLSLRKSGRSHSTVGFTLVELLIVAALLAIVAGFSYIMIGSALKARDVEVAVRTVSLEMRRARQISVDSRRQTRVIFTPPRTIRTERKAPAAEGGMWSVVSSLELPGDLEFRIHPSVPIGPEGHSVDEEINFSGFSEIYFMPDGSAIASNGLISNGVVYVSRSGEVETMRAVTLFGATGRLKQWEYQETGPEYWE